MKLPDALLSLYDDQLDDLPNDSHSIATILELFEDPPIGITQLKFKYKLVPLCRSGPKGWTYFPENDDGTRLARISYNSLVRGVSVTGLVKLSKVATELPDTDSYTVADFAILTIENLSSHGHVEYRETSPNFKRRKLHICN
jgi:hypothetical protein